MVPLESFKRLGRRLATEQARFVVPGPEHERLKADLLALTATVKRPRRRAPLGLGFALAAAVAAYLIWGTPRDLAYVIGPGATPAKPGLWMSAPASEALKIQFSDGTHASLWPGARGRVTRLSPRGADLVVEQGRVSLAVVHHAESHWQVSTGPFAVQVTGTRFDVEWQPEKDRFELELFEGHVRVTGCALGEGQELSAGQRIEASCARHEFAISAIGSQPALAALPAQRAESGEPSPESPAELGEPHAPRAHRIADGASRPVDGAQAASVAPANSALADVTRPWLALARAGQFADAYAAALGVGFDAECLTRGSAELLLLADSARLSGHIDRARQAYQALRRRWPGTPGAALAAFQIGKTEFDQRRDYPEAEGWLRTYLREQPAGEFAAPALGRLMEAEIRLNRYESGRELAKTYLDRYPKGSHADAAHQVLGASAAVAR
jgi:TolA-binding protein